MSNKGAKTPSKAPAYIRTNSHWKLTPPTQEGSEKTNLTQKTPQNLSVNPTQVCPRKDWKKKKELGKHWPRLFTKNIASCNQIYKRSRLPCDLLV